MAEERRQTSGEQLDYGMAGKPAYSPIIQQKDPSQTLLYQRDDEQDRRHTARERFFKPLILRTPALAILLVITLLLLGLTELAVRKLPNAVNRGIVSNIQNYTNQLSARQTDGFIPPSEEPANITSTQTGVDGTEETVVIIRTYGSPQNTCPGSTCGPAAPQWLIIGTVTVGQAKPVIIPSPIVTPVNPDPIPTPIVNPGITDPVVQPSAGATPQPQGPSPTNGAVPTNDPAATIVPVATNPADPGVSTPVNSAITPGESNSPAESDPNSVEAAVTTIISSDGSAQVFVFTPSGTITAKPTGTDVRGPNPTSGSSDSETESVSDDGSVAIVRVFTNAQYFLGAFLPTIIAVLFTIPWGAVDAAAKSLEPFSQMSGYKGASASNSLSLNYPGGYLFASPFKALIKGHWIIFITSLLNILALTTAPIASETVFIGLRGTCNATAGGAACIPTVSVFKTAARVIEVVLAIMAVILICLLLLNRKRPSGVFADPSSLAGIATLFSNQEMLDVFRALPSGVKEKNLVRLLEQHKYGLGYFHNSDGTMSYGFVAVSEETAPAQYHEAYSTILLNDPELTPPSKARKCFSFFVRVLQIVAFAAFILALMAVVLYYRFVSADSPFERFMNSQGFGVRFLFTTIGVIVNQFWGYTRDLIHHRDAYHNLIEGAAKPEDSVLLNSTPLRFSSFLTSLHRLAVFPALIDLSSLLSDVLTITLANIPFSNGTSYTGWIVCCYITIAILVIMLATLCVAVFKVGRMRGEAHPETLAGKMGLLCAGRMVGRFSTLVEMNGKERDGIVKGWGEVYAMGECRGLDGIVRKGVDFAGFVDRDIVARASVAF